MKNNSEAMKHIIILSIFTGSFEQEAYLEAGWQSDVNKTQEVEKFLEALCWLNEDNSNILDKLEESQKTEYFKKKENRLNFRNITKLFFLALADEASSDFLKKHHKKIRAIKDNLENELMTSFYYLNEKLEQLELERPAILTKVRKIMEEQSGRFNQIAENTKGAVLKAQEFTTELVDKAGVSAQQLKETVGEKFKGKKSLENENKATVGKNAPEKPQVRDRTPSIPPKQPLSANGQQQVKRGVLQQTEPLKPSLNLLLQRSNASIPMPVASNTSKILLFTNFLNELYADREEDSSQKKQFVTNWIKMINSDKGNNNPFEKIKSALKKSKNSCLQLELVRKGIFSHRLRDLIDAFSEEEKPIKCFHFLWCCWPIRKQSKIEKVVLALKQGDDNLEKYLNELRKEFKIIKEPQKTNKVKQKF